MHAFSFLLVLPLEERCKVRLGYLKHTWIQVMAYLHFIYPGEEEFFKNLGKLFKNLCTYT